MKKGYIAVLIGGQKFVWKELEFDKELFDRMVINAKNFMQAVQGKQPPIAMAGDKETLGKLYKGTEGGQLELEEAAMKSIDQDLEERDALKRTIESAEQRIEEIENRIKQEMGENDLAMTEKYKITWKSQISRRLDTEKVKAAGIYDEYCKETVARVFRVNANKKKGKE
jgi:predicted phage-related endonuclease